MLCLCVQAGGDIPVRFAYYDLMAGGTGSILVQRQTQPCAGFDFRLNVLGCPERIIRLVVGVDNGIVGNSGAVEGGTGLGGGAFWCTACQQEQNQQQGGKGGAYFFS